MHSTVFNVAMFASIFVALAIAVFLPLFLSSDRQKAADAKAHARRIADAKRNARLLRLNL